jgi:hypothetical protein
MRTIRLLGAALCIAAVAACTSGVERRTGNAAPAGSPAQSASPIAPAESAPPAPSGTLTSSPSRNTASPKGQLSEIRKTDWRNVSVRGLDFCGGVDDVVTFRNGSNGYDIPCLMLPGGARPVYAEFLVEEPANRPATEDALVLVELGNRDAARQQALVPIAVGDDGRTRLAWPVIKGDESSPSGDKVMTFTAYRIERGTVVATVKRLDGKSETRRYRQAGMFGPWERF